MVLKRSIITSLFTVILFVAFGAQAQLIKSPNDPRDFRYLTLNNGLEVLLISDLESDKGAASLNVEVGSNANPKDRAGLAHFLEHMLFLGTAKYPEADSYQAFINSNGGSHNAFTAYENTNYFFDVTASAFPGALDRFSQFFISPLFNEEYVERERNAVHSEYESKRLEDGRRIYVANKLAMNPEHHWTQFSVGNLDTLRNDPSNPIRDDLIAFFERYYSANLMTLAVSAPLTLDSLEALVSEKFSGIKNRTAEPYQDNVALIKPEQTQYQLNVKTLKDIRQLSLTFPVDARQDYWDRKPLYFIANQLGYEGKGSLLSYLKKQGLADGLGAWVGIDLPEQATFDINVDLTEKGLKHIDDIVQSVFSAIELIKKEGIQPSLYAEQAQLASNNFMFQERSEPVHNVMRLSQMMNDYPAEQILRAVYAYDHFDPSLIKGYLNQLTPNNLVLGLYSNDLPTNQIESRYNIEYAISPIDQTRIDNWSKPAPINHLTIKGMNPFVADDFTLLTSEIEYTEPEKYKASDLIDVWYLQDQQFEQPRGAINLAFLSPNAQPDASAVVANNLLTSMITEQLNETLYDAALAGLGANLYAHKRGISIKVTGYSQQLDQLMIKMVGALDTPLADEEVFKRLKSNLQEDLANSLKDKPFNRTFAALYDQTLGGWTTAQQLAVIDLVDLASINQRREALLSQGQLRLFVHGNLSKEQTETLTKVITNRFSAMEPVDVEPITSMTIPEGETTSTVNVEHTDKAMLLYLQSDSDSVAARAQTSIINEMLSTPFYTQLRTEQQLGYAVFTNYLPIAETPGIGLTVQSPSASVAELRAAYTAFLTQWRSQLPKSLATHFDQFKASVRSRIESPAQRLSDETARLWREIDRENADFDSKQQLLKALDQTTRDQIIERVDQLLNRKLWIQTRADQASKG